MGFNWNEGPFELLVEYGLDNYIHRLQNEGIEVPELLVTMTRLKQEPYDSTSSRAYNHEAGMKFINRGEGVRRLGDHKKYANPVFRNHASTVWQFTDDIRKQRLLVCEFHTKANALNGDAMKVSGDPETVFAAGIAVRGKVVAESEVPAEQEQDMIVRWVDM